MPDRIPLELLAPAKNAEFGMAAVDHGADAVYIGGPAFGARYGAGNQIADIERLATHAHRFNAKVLVALNTILTDDELEQARAIAWQVYEAGADALIVQDMGLLEMDLPPIQLHASTQTDNRTLEKVKFLEDAGFSQIVLARELTLPEIRHIANGTRAALEFFVHGALCVSYSGQCYISHAHTGRSANRGECSQACRLPYTLKDGEGRVVAWEKHLLSMKDNDQSANLRLLADAGIRSFKIEGRLKDLSYVKNITAHYRQLLDGIMAEAPRYVPAASGRAVFTFTPRPEKTFNRGATDYFVSGRQEDIGAFDSPAFMGESVGRVSRLDRAWFEVEATAPIHNGDGLTWFDAHGELQGIRINRAEAIGGAQRLHPALAPGQQLAHGAPDLAPGTELFRNRDQEFERLLEKDSAQRRLSVKLSLAETEEGFALTLEDEDGVRATVTAVQAKVVATNAERAMSSIREGLSKLGGTMFEAVSVTLDLAPRLLPAAFVNGLRRDGVLALEAAREAAYRRPLRAEPVTPPPSYPAADLSYLGNVLNAKARAFYARHGVQVIEAAYEANREEGEVALMTTRHCLRYSYNLCPKQVKGIRPDPMTLVNGKEKLTLIFDCKRCEMQVVGKMKKSVLRSIPIRPV
ncbi:MAG: U32 family peptidase [Rhodocyclaceae bacterium]|nr:U32 family peptidase [Rhodocyclaceae bacterium]